MKEAYAVRRTVPPSAEIQASIDKLLSRGGVDDPQKMLSELARLGARLIIQRAVEEEFDTWLGRARYERRPERQRGLRNCLQWIPVAAPTPINVRLTENVLHTHFRTRPEQKKSPRFAGFSHSGGGIRT